MATLSGKTVGLQAGSGPSAKWLVTERAATLRDPRWYLYDPRDGRLRRILDDPGITAGAPEEAALARKLAIAYTASDGRRVHGFVLAAYDIPRGCLAAYYPETNPLVPLDSYAERARTPTSKAIPVVLHPHDPAQSGAQARDIPAAVVG